MGSKLLLNIISGTGVRVLGMLVALFSGVVLARVLGPEAYGEYGVIVGVLLIFIIIGQFGLSQFITREISGAVKHDDRSLVTVVMGWSIRIAFIASISAVLLGFLYLYIFGEKYDQSFRQAFFYMLATVPFVVIITLFAAFLRGIGHNNAFQGHDALFRQAIFLGVILLTVALGRELGLVRALYLQLIAAVGGFIFCVVHYVFFCDYKLNGLPKTILSAKGQAPHSEKWGKSARLFAASEVIRIFEGQYPLFLVFILAEGPDAGFLRVAMALCSVVSMPITVISHLVMPLSVSGADDLDEESLQSVASLSVLAGSFVAILAVIGTLLLGQFAILLLFGDAYTEAWGLLFLIVVSIAIEAMFGQGLVILNMRNRQTPVLLALILGILIGLIYILIFYSAFGLLAVGHAYIISRLVRGLALAFFVKRYLNVDVTIWSGFKALRSFKNLKL